MSGLQVLKRTLDFLNAKWQLQLLSYDVQCRCSSSEPLLGFTIFILRFVFIYIPYPFIYLSLRRKVCCTGFLKINHIHFIPISN
jgi:hypothetical protein